MGHVRTIGYTIAPVDGTWPGEARTTSYTKIRLLGKVKINTEEINLICWCGWVTRYLTRVERQNEGALYIFNTRMIVYFVKLTFVMRQCYTVLFYTIFCNHFTAHSHTYTFIVKALTFQRCGGESASGMLNVLKVKNLDIRKSLFESRSLKIYILLILNLSFVISSYSIFQLLRCL